MRKHKINSLGHDSLAVANEVLRVAKSKKLGLTLMQLLKLVYLAQGWSLALLKKPIVEDDVEAWQYGPVYPRVYREFNRYGPNRIGKYAENDFSGLQYSSDFDDNDLIVIKSVVNSYGHLHAFKLSELTHQPGTPWNIIYNDEGPYSVIPTDLIRDHFISLKRRRDARRK